MSGRHLRVLRIYHSGVVRSWRQRDVELARCGIDVTLVSPRRWDEGGADVQAEPAPAEDVRLVRTFGRHPFRFAYEPVGLWRALRSCRWDVLDIHEEPASLAAFEVRLLARVAGIGAPFCLYRAENLVKRYPPPFRWFERATLRAAAAVHTCNPQAGTHLRALGFSGRIRNLGLGVDLPGGLDPAAPEDGSLPLRVGYVGRLTTRKGVFVLARAMALVPDASLDLFGDGPDRPELEALVRKLGIEHRVTFRGHTDAAELPPLLRALDVVVVPSLDTPRWSEQFGRVVPEAQACGAAVVVSDAGSLPWVAGEPGVVVPQGDVDALAAALDRLALDRDELGRLRALGRASAERFTWSSIATQQAALYRAMLTEGAPERESPAEVGR